MAALRTKTNCCVTLAVAPTGKRYLYIIELGQRLAPLSPEEHSVQNIIQGCQSEVWIVMDGDPTGVITLRGDSDAAIVKGLIAVVFILYDRMTAQDITEFDDASVV